MQLYKTRQTLITEHKDKPRIPNKQDTHTILQLFTGFYFRAVLEITPRALFMWCNALHLFQSTAYLKSADHLKAGS